MITTATKQRGRGWEDWDMNMYVSEHKKCPGYEVDKVLVNCSMLNIYSYIIKNGKACGHHISGKIVTYGSNSEHSFHACLWVRTYKS